jgi:DNA mismatch repair protein MutL
VRLSGHASLPTYNRRNARAQYLFVNGRPVRDRLLTGAVRGAYADFLASDRHPVVALFVECPHEAVDVNVHPAKAEVRFRDAGLVRGLIVGALRHALAEAGHRASTTVAAGALGAFRPGAGSGGAGGYSPPPSGYYSGSGMSETAAGFQAPLPGQTLPGTGTPSARVEAAPAGNGDGSAHPLGAARAQLHGTYVVAQTADGLVIVDQHAAHERLVYERMKKALAHTGVARQGLLLPEVVELDEADAARLGARADELAELGLGLEAFGPGAVVVREVPALLGETDGRRPGPARAPGRGLLDHGLPRQRARRSRALGRGNERAVARNGGHPPLGPVQPRPPHLRGAQARRHRAPLRPALKISLEL